MSQRFCDDDTVKSGTWCHWTTWREICEPKCTIACEEQILFKKYIFQPRYLLLIFSGRNKGLVVILDAHSDVFSVGSVDSNSEGFIAMIR